MLAITNEVSLPTLAPIAGFLTLLELSIGTALVAYVIDLLSRVGRGYVGSTMVICAAVTGITIWIGVNIPTDITLLHATISEGALSSLLRWSAVFAGAALISALFSSVGTDAARRVVGAVTLAIGAVCIGKAAVAFGPAFASVASALAVFIPGTLVTGTALAGMLLGHWYLVAPSLSFRPLRQMVTMLLGAVAIEAAILIAVVVAASPAARDQLIGGYALPFWLLVVGSGIVFT
ncbi:MAG: hypothetical protein JOY80_10370, partial [Candidatus Dormibacteraeota bacterium]|nr:hypothetical protein [Candidatus Dormibacteraeota bacterium]